jgi:hypothetical protein
VRLECWLRNTALAGASVASLVLVAVFSLYVLAIPHVPQSMNTCSVYGCYVLLEVSLAFFCVR